MCATIHKLSNRSSNSFFRDVPNEKDQSKVAKTPQSPPCQVKARFGDLSLAENQSALNEYLIDKSYLSPAAFPTTLDATAFNAMPTEPEAELVNLVRWWRHIKSYRHEFARFESGSL